MSAPVLYSKRNSKSKQIHIHSYIKLTLSTANGSGFRERRDGFVVLPDHLDHVPMTTCSLFPDDAEVQRQKVVPVLIGGRGGVELCGHHCLIDLPHLAHLDSP